MSVLQRYNVPTNWGIAMGCPLGPTMPNIFVGFYEQKLFSIVCQSNWYVRYVDDTFYVFIDELEAKTFHEIVCTLLFSSLLKVTATLLYLSWLSWNKDLILSLFHRYTVISLFQVYILAGTFFYPRWYKINFSFGL